MHLPTLPTVAGLICLLPVAVAVTSVKETAWNDRCSLKVSSVPRDFINTLVLLENVIITLQFFCPTLKK